jgi:Fe-S cluster assembly protein SufD
MRFEDISTEKQTTYRLGANEKAVFFMLNRSGNLVFELAGTGAEAHIFALFTGKGADKAGLAITQRHLAPKTVSHALIKSALSDQSSFTYDGLIRIEKKALLSDASQECRSLLLSPDASASSRPSLEILNDDVSCRHAATASSVDAEQLFFAQSRGLSKAQATELLVQGFFNDVLNKMNALNIDKESMGKIMKKLSF